MLRERGPPPLRDVTLAHSVNPALDRWRPRVKGGSMSFDTARAAAKAYETDVAHIVNSWHEQVTKGTSDLQGR